MAKPGDAVARPSSQPHTCLGLLSTGGIPVRPWLLYSTARDICLVQQQEHGVMSAAKTSVVSAAKTSALSAAKTSALSAAKTSALKTSASSHISMIKTTTCARLRRADVVVGGIEM